MLTIWICSRSNYGANLLIRRTTTAICFECLTAGRAVAIERKHQNISAILIEPRLTVYRNGYKPLRNYQELLREVVEEGLLSAPALDDEIASLVISPPPPAPPFLDILGIRVPVPVPDRKNRTSIYESPATAARQIKRNYLEIEARNSALGLAGEQLVVRYEQERLSRAGRDKLADKIIHISVMESEEQWLRCSLLRNRWLRALDRSEDHAFRSADSFFCISKRGSNYLIAEMRTTNSIACSNSPNNRSSLCFRGSLKRTCQLDPVSFSARLA